MAKTRTYIVSFNKAERTERGGSKVSFEIGQPNTDHRVTTDSFDKLEAEVRRLAADYGRTCSPYIRLPAGERTPPGFGAFRDRMHIIDVPTPAEVDAYIANLNAAEAAAPCE